MKKTNLILIVLSSVLIIGIILYANRSEKSSPDEKISVPVANSGENAPPGSIHNLPVPAAVSAVRTAVAKRVMVGEGEVVILKESQEIWPDACLGLAQKNMMCAAVMTPGHLVTAIAQGKTFTYRTNADGTVIRPEK